MTILKRLCFAACLGVAALSGSELARGQSTDAYHSIQVFPVVVDSTSYAQRFVFKNPNGVDISVTPRYFPGTNTVQATSIICEDFVIPAGRSVAKTSLRAICPALATGSQFGFLHVGVTGGSHRGFSAFSRASNPQGQGFTVEAFAANEFTAADSVVNGIRRLAATTDTPAFQTNCFIGLINSLDSPDVAGMVNFKIFGSNGVKVGEGNVATGSGKLTRLLDVFNAGAAPAVDYNDAQIRFTYLGPNEPGMIAFCTVQENTSFVADFRIGKQEYADGAEAFPGKILGPQDITRARTFVVNKDSLGRPFEINAGASANTHVIYLQSPDAGYCDILDPNTNMRALPSYGLELRVIDGETGELDAGGNNSTVVPDAALGQGNYFGDKGDGGTGANNRVVLEVESNEQNTAAVRPYKLRCQTGSGSTLGDIIRYKEEIDRF